MTLPVEVAYALPDRQTVIALEVPAGTTVLQAIRLSGILDLYPGIDPERAALGVFGRVVRPDHPVSAHDRVEIYRPLLIDPKHARRERARGRRAERGDPAPEEDLARPGRGRPHS